MEELVFSYKKRKMFINFAIMMLAVVIIVTLFMSMQNPSVATMIIFAIVFLVIAILVVLKLVSLKKMDYFIRCNEKGIYTAEAFPYCDWKKINTIELKRYMGYQTLFFQIDEQLEAKFKPIMRNGKQYYCLPLADCKGKPKVILEKIQNFKND